MLWLDGKQRTIGTSTSPLAFHVVHNPDAWGSRFLLVNGQPAFELGIHCGTCSFLFGRLEGAPLHVSPGGLDGPLRAGLRRLDEAALDAASPLIPQGTYDVCLLELSPRLVRPFSDEDYFAHEQAEVWGPQGYDYWTGLPHFTHTAYYRADDLALGADRKLFQFLVPLFPPLGMDEKTVSEYETRLRAGERPTALALSVLDVKQPAVWAGNPEITDHWCLAHFLVDGHHKVYAAAEARQPVTVMAFVARGEGASTPSEVDMALDALRTSGSSKVP